MPITVSVSGRLTRDMEIKELANGTKLCTFTIASDRKYKNKDGERDTDFLDVKCFVVQGKEAQIEHRTPVLRKGRPVWIIGAEFNIETWEGEDGKKRKNPVARIWTLYEVEYDGSSISQDSGGDSPPF